MWELLIPSQPSSSSDETPPSTSYQTRQLPMMARTCGHAHLSVHAVLALCALSSSTAKRRYPQQGRNTNKRLQSDNNIAGQVQDPIIVACNAIIWDVIPLQSPQSGHCSTYHAVKGSWVTGHSRASTTHTMHLVRPAKMTRLTPLHSIWPSTSPPPLHGLTRLQMLPSHGTWGHPSWLYHGTHSVTSPPPPLSSTEHHPPHRLAKGSSSAKFSPRMCTVSVIDHKT